MKLNLRIKTFLLLLYSFSSPFFFVTFQATITLLMLLIGLALGQTQVQQVPTGQFGCGILKIVGPKMQFFAQESTCSKEIFSKQCLIFDELAMPVFTKCNDFLWVWSCFLGPTIFKIPQPNWHYYVYSMTDVLKAEKYQESS